MSALDSVLQRFKTQTNRLSWGDLGGALVGGVLFRVFEGFIAIPQGIAAGIEAVVSPITGALNSGVGGLTSTITTEAAAAWDPITAGPVSLLLNLAVVLVAVFVIVRGWEVAR